MPEEVCNGTFDGKEVVFTYSPDQRTLTVTLSKSGLVDRVIRNAEVVTVMKDSSYDGWLIKEVRSIAPGKGDKFDCQLDEHEVEDLPQQFIQANAMSEIHPYQWHYASVPESLAIIRSSGAGTGRAEDHYERNVVRALEIDREWAKYDIHDSTTVDEHSITGWAKEILDLANNGDRQTILLLSGDGGVHDIINTLLLGARTTSYCRPRLGLLPLGTGNAIANSTGLNSDSTLGLRQFFRGVPHSLPTFTVRFSPGSVILKDQGRSEHVLPTDGQGLGLIYGAVVCSWALHASLVANSDTPEYRKYGAEGFVKAASDLVDPPDGSPSHTYRGRVTVYSADANGIETERILARRDHMYILATMQSHLAEGFNISPLSKPLDGQLRLVHFGPMASDQVWRVMNLAMDDTGRHVKQKGVNYESITGMRIDFEEEDAQWRRVCVDGQIVRINRGGFVELKKNDFDVVQLIADLPQ